MRDVCCADTTQRMLYLLGDEGASLAACDDIVNTLAVLLLGEVPHDDWERVARFLLCTLHPGMEDKVVISKRGCSQSQLATPSSLH